MVFYSQEFLVGFITLAIIYFFCNRYYVKIPDTVLDLPGKLYIYIKSNTLATGLSNALRVDMCYQEETLTNGNNNN